MMLRAGGDMVRFKQRPLEGASEARQEADRLILDGQQWDDLRDRIANSLAARLCSGLMLRLVLAVLAAVVLQVGCGSGTAKPQTVVEYAALACGTIGDELSAEDATWGEMDEGLDEYLEVMDGVEPPDSVRDWHNSQVAMLKSSRDYAKKQDADATINPFELLGEPGLVALALAYGAVVDELSAGDLTALRSAGCEVD